MVTSDGGITQLAAAINDKSFDQKRDRNEDYAKLSKNRSAVNQPCDQGNGHKGQRHHIHKLSHQLKPRLSIASNFDKKYYEEHDKGKLNLASHKLQELRAAVSRTPDVIRIVYHENGVIKCFVIPGWLDKETFQGPNILEMFRTLKRKYITEECNKWTRDLPVFIQDMHQFGYTYA